MNWNYIFTQVFIAFVQFVAIFGSYLISKFYVQEKRKNEKKKASLLEKIWICFEAILASGLIGIIAARDIHAPKFFIIFFIVVIPALFGLTRAFEIDAKLTSEKRERLRFKIERESRDTSRDDIA